MPEIGLWPVTSRSRTVLVAAATALGLAVGVCDPAGSDSPHQPVRSPACNHALTVEHVPGHVDRVWQLVCTGETTDSGQPDRPASPPTTGLCHRFRPDAGGNGGTNGPHSIECSIPDRAIIAAL